MAMTADDCLAAEQRLERPGPEADELREAESFLNQALANGPHLTKEVEEESREVHGIKKRTLERARKNLGVESFRETVPGPWFLRLSSNTANNTANST